MLQLLFDPVGLVERIVDLDAVGNLCLRLLDQLLDPLDRVDDVFANPLLHFDRDRGLAVVAKIDAAIEERAPHVGDVSQRHDAVARNLDRQIEHVLRLLDEARNLNREASAARIQIAGGDQLVVRGNDAEEIAARHAVALHARRIDDDFENLVGLS